MNPKDAERLGVKDGDEVELEGIDNGFKARARVRVTNRVREGVLFAYAFLGGRGSSLITEQFAYLREGVNPQWFATGKIEPVVDSAPTNSTVRVRRL
jgi:thiosulfate reductase/polysulfide reductase chain A